MHYAARDGSTLACSVTGPDHGIPVVFIHGFPLHAEMWRDTAESLQSRYRCILPDLRGFGGSRSADLSAVSIQTFADDVAAALDALDEQRPAVFVGLSMGGMITFELWRRHRARVRALALCSTRFSAENDEGRTRRERAAQLALSRGPRPLADEMIERLLSPDADDDVRDRVYAMMLEASGDAIAAASRAMASRPDSWPTLATIARPTLVCTGEDDAVTPVDLHEQMHAAIPGSRLVVIPRAGHLSPMERPDDFTLALRAFLDRLP